MKTETPTSCEIFHWLQRHHSLISDVFSLCFNVLFSLKKISITYASTTINFLTLSIHLINGNITEIEIYIS